MTEQKRAENMKEGFNEGLYELSNFPESYDVFRKKSDLQLSDKKNVRRFQELWSKDSRTPEELTEMNNLKTSLEKYTLTAQDINLFQGALTQTQKFFNQNTQGYVDRLQLETTTHTDVIKADTLADSLAKKNETKAYVDNKKAEMNTFVTEKQVEITNKQVDSINHMELSKNDMLLEVSRFTYRGIYSPTTRYMKWNTVKLRGVLYLCILETLGNSPSESTRHWTQIAENGDAVKWRGTWSQVIRYKYLDLISYRGNIYICKMEHMDKTPEFEEAYWDLVLTNHNSNTNNHYTNYKKSAVKITHNLGGYPKVQALTKTSYGHGGYGMFGINNEYQLDNIVEYITPNEIKVHFVEEFKGVPTITQKNINEFTVVYSNESNEIRLFIK